MPIQPDPALASSSALAGFHFHLGCYVCGPACTRASPFESWSTFAQIFQRRPDGCRFAVVRMVPLAATTVSGNRIVVTAADEPEGDWLVWDLLEERLVRGRDLSTPPEPLWRGPSEEAMAMKAMALYGRD